MAVSPAPAPSADRLPPQNLEAETAVLGSILVSDRVLDEIMVDVRLRPEDFYRERHGHVFAAMLELKDGSEPVDALTVCEALTRSGLLELVGGEDYVHSLPTAVPLASSAPHYAKIVRENAKLRGLLAAAQQIQEDVLERSGDTTQLIDQAESALFRIALDDESQAVRPIEEVLHEELDRLEKVSRQGLEISGTPTGFHELDDLTGGFQPGNLIVIAARPSMGKSALVTNMAENASVDFSKGVALFSLEMSEVELAQRFIASQAKLNGDDLRKGRVKEERWPKILRATEALASSPLFVDDSSDLGIHELRAKARRLHMKQPNGLGLIIVDYLQLMRAEDPRVGRVEQIGQMSRGLKILARELMVPVIAVSQLSRAPELRPDKRPMLSDLRESGQIEQDADVVIFVYRDEYYDKESERPGEADLIVAKHRNGPVGEVSLAFLSKHPKFANLARFGGAASVATVPDHDG
ncbi:MAG: replicative DNA helicase [Thermoleophilaceae bacterium]|nr:replicative DNA helicase [Thermoleophilaceae bacterium]